MAAGTAVVVGGCGFLGTHVSGRLVENGLEVISVHRSDVHDHRGEGIRCVRSDYRDAKVMAELLSGRELLIHLGSQSVPRTSVELGVSGVLTEVEANSRLFEVAADAGVSKVVFASSGGSVYGNCEPGRPIAESHPCQPVSPHGLLKVMTELALSHIALTAGQAAVSLRPGNIYGPGQRLQPMFGVVPTFLGNLRAGRSSEIWGAESVRDYIHVSDASRAFVAAALTDRPLPRAINVGTGTGHTAVELYSMLQELTGLHQPIKVLPRPVSDPAWSVLATEKLSKALGVTPQVDLHEGLRGLVEMNR